MLWTVTKESKSQVGLLHAGRCADIQVMPRVGDDSSIVNFVAVALRERTTKAHVWLTYLVSLVLAAYVSVTWEHPHRIELVGLIALYVLTAVVVSMLPADLLLLGRRRDVALLLWSFTELLLIAAMSALDGGVRSPLTPIFLVPLLVSALSAPLLGVLAVGVMGVIAYIGLAVDLGSSADPRIMVFTFALGLAALTGAWIARIFEDRQHELVRVSRTDPLTQSLNRRGFAERVEAALDDARRTGRSLALVLLDLDRFKDVNDTLGHARGDQLLRWTVSTLRGALRPMDCIGRLGGDEFAVLLPCCTREDAMGVLGRFDEMLHERAPASIGLSCFPHDGDDVESLLRHADDELYSAKRMGGTLRNPHSPELGWAAMIGRAVDVRMAGRNAHSNHVAQTAVGIGRELGLESHELLRLRIAGMLHDVGNVLLPDRILHSPRPLTNSERDEVERSRLTAAKLLGEVDGVADVSEWIRHCHEHVDGSGYPDGLCGDQIPLASRILHVADAYEALISGEPPHVPMQMSVALSEVERGAPRAFDSECAMALRRHLEKTAADIEDEAKDHATLTTEAAG
jgi:diguanylate cyclase (GGDEF)-like protein